MTVIRDLLEVPSFVNALRGLAAIDAKQHQVLLASLNEASVEPPADVHVRAGTSWRTMGSAFSLAYEASRSEGVDAVVEDLRESEIDFNEGELERLKALLEVDKETDEQISGVHQRDGFLPIFRNADLALDLRVLDLEGGTKLAPVLTVRMSFDEAVNGNDSIVFQLPVAALRQLQDQLAQVSKQLGRAQEIARASPVPDWSLKGLELG